ASLAILAGAVLSALLAPPALVIASATAFLLSEFADLVVYTPLARRGLLIAVVASGVVGLVADSVVFLWLRCGPLHLLPPRLRLAWSPAGPERRQGVDGAGVGSVRGLAAAARRARGHRAGLRPTQGGFRKEVCL